MTVKELFNMPVGMTPDEWQRVLNRKNKIIKRLGKLSAERDFLADALDMLSDEVGSDRYMKKENRKQEVDAEMEHLGTELSKVMKQYEM